jgi:hypothetical protein
LTSTPLVGLAFPCNVRLTYPLFALAVAEVLHRHFLIDDKGMSG